MRQTVRYADGLGTLLSRGHTLFLELGPKPVLTRLGERLSRDTAWSAACDPDDPAAEWKALARCYVEGCDVRWETVYPQAQYRLASVPAYPFDRKRYWIERVGPAASPRALYSSGSGTPAWRNRFVDVLTCPCDW